MRFAKPTADIAAELVVHNGPETQAIKVRPAKPNFEVIEDNAYDGRI